ncbi:MAG: hypothetical protein LBU89_03405 [Fibromonadaceae bacterium]|jgi:hypothetical protein|nr:hypothetical protein [Fibromonadaceae bacterium]
MKKIFLCLTIIILFIAYNYSLDVPKQNSSSIFLGKENIPESLVVYMPDTIKRILLRQDTIKIKIDINIDTLAVYFDCANLKIIKEENYFAALKDENLINSMEDLIAYEEPKSEFMCRKKSLGATISVQKYYDPNIGAMLNAQRPNPDIVKVKFGNQFILYWDCANDEIMEDENFFSILQSKENIYFMAHFITNEEIVCDRVCSKGHIPKKGAHVLKKGDIAYLFLSEYYNRLIYNVECLGRQFGSSFPRCKYNNGLLDYIEEHRDLVFQKVISCLESKLALDQKPTHIMEFEITNSPKISGGNKVAPKYGAPSAVRNGKMSQ